MRGGAIRRVAGLGRFAGDRDDRFQAAFGAVVGFDGAAVLFGDAAGDGET